MVDTADVIELHIITNCVPSAPKTLFVSATYASFCEAFRDLRPTVWCDPNPRPEIFSAYCANLRDAGFDKIHQTAGLADAYLRILSAARADYIFVLEHDWTFHSDCLDHSLGDILVAMNLAGLYYLRFNQTATAVRGMDTTLEEHTAPGGMKYCLSPCWSGNPHILDRKKCLALDVPGRIHARKNMTLERKLTRDHDLSGAIYGPLGHPPVIHHLDAREDEPKPFWDDQRQAREKKKGRVHLGIVVPAYNLPDQENLQQRFLDTVANDARPQITYEVLFVTPDRFDIVNYEDGREIFNIAKAYNAGIRYFKNRARFIACTDIDLLFPPGFFEHAVFMARQRPHTHLARYIPPNSALAKDWDKWAVEKTPERGTGAWNCMTWADYMKIGGFNEAMFGWGFIDFDFTYRKIQTYGLANVLHDATMPMMHVNHPERGHVKRSRENRSTAEKWRDEKFNWLTGQAMTETPPEPEPDPGPPAPVPIAGAAAPAAPADIELGVVVPACNLPNQPYLQRRFMASIRKDARPKISWEVLFVTPDKFDVYTREKGRDHFNIAKAYNAGIRYFKDRARFIACADIDLLFPPGFFEYSVAKAQIKPFCGRVRLINENQAMPRQWKNWEKLTPRPGTGAWNCMTYADYYKIGGFCEAMFGWGGIDTDFKQRENIAFGPDGTIYDATMPLMHVNHPDRSVVAPRRPGENMAISNHYRKLNINWLDLDNLTLSATA